VSAFITEISLSANDTGSVRKLDLDKRTVPIKLRLCHSVAYIQMWRSRTNYRRGECGGLCRCYGKVGGGR